MISTKDVTTRCTYLTGRFPNKSSRGNEYIMVGYNCDDNYVMGVPLRNKKGETITEAWQNIHNKFKKASDSPKTYVLIMSYQKNLLNILNHN